MMVKQRITGTEVEASVVRGRCGQRNSGFDSGSQPVLGRSRYEEIGDEERKRKSGVGRMLPQR